MKQGATGVRTKMKLSSLGISFLLLAACNGASPNGEPAKDEAAQTATDLEAAAENTEDPKEAEVLHNQANALSDVAEGDKEDVEGEVVVTGQ